MHAYLIIAHNEFDILEKLVRSLDNTCSDIFIHIDKSVKDFDFKRFEYINKHMNVHFTERIHINWGDYSMVKCEYILLKAAMNSMYKYDYFHLISGVDLPLCNQAELYRRIDENYGRQFVHFGNVLTPTEEARVKYYHFFSGRRNLFNRFMTKAESKIQKLLGVNRIKNIEIGRGSQWFSISSEFAAYLLQQEKFVKKHFKHTFIPDEFFVQTVLLNSPYKNRLYSASFDDDIKQNLRCIDWKRGNPYTYTESDYHTVINSGCIFVRKLTSKNRLPDMIYEKVMKEW